MSKHDLLFFVLVVLMMVSGCRKQVSTLQDVPKVAENIIESEQINPFEGIDTTDEISFVEADLASDLAEKVKKNLKTIYFDFNSYSFNADAIDNLNTASRFLTDNAGIRVLIQGHCDERGSSEYNMGLGERRARAVKDYLLNFGIMAIRLEITSLGKEQPAVYGCTDESCHIKNRRVEFIVLQNR